MMKTFALSLFASICFAGACTTTPTTSSARRPIIDTPCAADTDCPTGFECEVEAEHGVTTSFCQAHDEPDDGSANGGCPDGYELEVEHGQSFCKPHGTGSGSGSGSDDGSGSGSGSGACTTNADCTAGLECELSTGTCQPHGGH